MPIAATLFDLNRQFRSNDDEPLAGGKVYFYEAGTDTPLDTYTDSLLTAGQENTNPIILNSLGFSDTQIYGLPQAYKVNVTDALDVQVDGWPRDNYGVATPEFA